MCQSVGYILELPVIASITMDSPIECEPSAVRGDTSAALNDEAALLRDALAFIGDLDFDLDATTPGEDDELIPSWHGGVSDVLPSIPISLLDPVAPCSDVASPAPSSTHEGSSASDASCGTNQVPQRSQIPLAETESDIAKPKTINRSRNRRIQELAYLRGLVGDLEERLFKLSTPAPASNRADGASGECPELVHAWAQVAMHQEVERQRAEAENTKLRQLLQEQIHVGKSLERLLTRKRPSLETFERGIAAKKRLRVRNNVLIFDELVANCGGLYADTERALARFSSASAKPYRDIQLVHDPELGMMLQTIDHRVLPFRYEDAVNVVWSSFPEMSTVSPANVDHDLSDTIIKLQFRVAADLGRTREDFDIKLVIRRYDEADRTVIVASGVIEPSEISPTDMAGVRIHQSGWHIFEPLPATLSCPHGATKELVFLRSVPEVEDDLDDKTRKVGTLTNFLLSMISLEVESRNEKVVNHLFDLSLKHAL